MGRGGDFVLARNTEMLSGQKYSFCCQPPEDFFGLKAHVLQLIYQPNKRFTICLVLLSVHLLKNVVAANVAHLISIQGVLRLQTHVAGQVSVYAVPCLLLGMFVLMMRYPEALVDLNIENKMFSYFSALRPGVIITASSVYRNLHLLRSLFCCEPNIRTQFANSSEKR